MHDASKHMMGTVGKSGAEISCEGGDPATFLAGLAVRRASTGSLSLTSGSLLGVSAGASLADTTKTAVVRSGSEVPIALTDEGVAASIKKGDITFTAVAKGTDGNSITVTGVDDAEEGSETVEVDGNDIVIHFESTVSTAQEIKDAIDASLDATALITATIDEGDEDAAQTAFVLDNLESGEESYPYVEIGAVVLVDTTSGKASSDGAATTGAMYLTTKKTGVNLDGTTQDVALIDMPGGL